MFYLLGRVFIYVFSYLKLLNVLFYLLLDCWFPSIANFSVVLPSNEIKLGSFLRNASIAAVTCIYSIKMPGKASVQNYFFMTIFERVIITGP